MTKEELEQKFEALLNEKGSLLATTDGQVFYNTPEGKKFAVSHAAGAKVQIIELKKSNKKAEEKPAVKASKKNKKTEEN